MDYVYKWGTLITKFPIIYLKYLKFKFDLLTINTMSQAIKSTTIMLTNITNINNIDIS